MKGGGVYQIQRLRPTFAWILVEMGGFGMAQKLIDLSGMPALRVRILRQNLKDHLFQIQTPVFHHIWYSKLLLQFLTY
jgi:hypothetical protein